MTEAPHRRARHGRVRSVYLLYYLALAPLAVPVYAAGTVAIIVRWARRLASGA